MPKIIALPRRPDSPVVETSATPGPTLPAEIEAAIEESVARYRTVLAELANKAPKTPGDLYEFEQELHARVPTRCLDPVTGAVIRHALEDDEVLLRAEALLASRQGMRLQKQGQRVNVALRGGSKVSFRTAYFLDRRRRPGGKKQRRKRGKPGSGLYPVLEALGIHERMTPAFGSEVARLVVTHSEDSALEELRRHGMRLDSKALRRIVGAVARRALAHREQAATRTDSATGSWLAGKRVGIFVDGGRLRVRLKKRGRKRKNGGKSFRAEWVEPKVLVICELDENGRKVRGGLLRYEATLGNADALFRLLAGILRELGACEADQWVVGGDGAKWIWNRYTKLVEELDYDPEKVFEVVDYWHAAGYLWEFVGLRVGWTQAQRRKWVHTNKRRLQRGRIADVIAEMRSHCLGRNAKKLKVLVNRFVANKDRMKYDEFRRGGIPCGTGAVESAVRRIVNLRLKGPGIFWIPENAEGLLHLRSQLLSGAWDHLMRRTFEPAPFWRRHPARGAEKLAA